MSSRATTPLQRINARDAQTLKKQVRATESAVLGNGQGRVVVEAIDDLQYSMVYFRFRDTSDVNDTAGFGLPLRARVEGDIPFTEGVPIRVRTDGVTNGYVVEGIAYEEANRRGLNTAQTFNSYKSTGSDIWIDNIRNLRLFFPTTNALSTLKVSVEPYLYVHNSVLKNAVKGQSDNLDLSSYDPGAGNERLVGAALVPSTNTIEFVAGTARTQTGNQWALSALQELIDGFSAGAIPMQAVRYPGGATELRNSDILFDLRQVFSGSISGSSGAGSSNVITKSNTIPAGKDAFFAGGLTITGGLTVSGELYILP